MLCRRRRRSEHDATMPSSDVDPTATNGMTVCIVEDHEILRSAMIALITDGGDRVVAAVGTVAAGLDAVLTLRPTIAVIDNQLPDGRGVDLCRTLSSVTPEVTVILHSGTVSDALREEGLAAGATQVISKSIRGEDLAASIARVRRNAPR